MKLFEDMYSVLGGSYEPPGTMHVKDEKGATGPDGKLGATGPEGKTGATGATGPDGQPGSDGATGAIGPPGQPGPQGRIGPPGPKGDTGATGPQGPDGPAGRAGATGARGERGLPGARGRDGADGATGPEGPQGKIGPNGWTAIFAGEAVGAKRFIKVVDWVGGKGRKPKLGYLTPEGIGLIEDATDFRGSRGPQGLRGHDGGGGGGTVVSNGSGSGQDGATGATGPAGAAGATGATGATGPAGGGVFFFQPDPPPELGLNEGDRWFESDTGIEYTWIVDEDGGQWVVPGSPEGPQGATGATGPQGPQGDNGATGATGPAGAQTFLDLTDTPDSYIGMAGKIVSVNAEATGLQFIDDPPSGQIFTLSANPPYDAIHGDEWMDEDTGAFYKFICDEDGCQWVEIISSAGPEGATGATGPAGGQGATGATGPQGNAGGVGATGATGPQGTAGGQGATGATGPFPESSATARILARKSAGPGVFEESTLSEVLDFIGSAARGDILYRGASAWAKLAAGTSGKFLQTKGASADPVWAFPEVVVKPNGGNEAVNNSTTLQDDNHLFFPIAANETVFFLLNAKFVEDGATNADIKIGFVGPSGVSDGQLVPINGIKVNESDSIVLQGAINIGGASAIAFGSALASRYAQCIGFVANGANAGNVTIQWAQNTAQTHDMIMQGGSCIVVWRVN